MQSQLSKRAFQLIALGSVLSVGIVQFGCGGGGQGTVTGTIIGPATANSYSGAGSFADGPSYSFTYHPSGITNTSHLPPPIDSGAEPVGPPADPPGLVKLEGTMTAFGSTFPIAGVQDATGSQHLTGTLSTAGGLGINMTFTIDNENGNTTVTASGTTMAGSFPQNLSSTTHVTPQF